MKIRLFDKLRKHHALLMIFCCAFPILVVLSFSYLGVIGSWGYYALFLLCPLSHIFMFRKSHADHGKEIGNKGHSTVYKRSNIQGFE